MDTHRARKTIAIVFLASEFSRHRAMGDVILGDLDGSAPDTWDIRHDLVSGSAGTGAMQDLPA